jgi:ABC-type branched-subunit amino acid transport system substrate-binding protein
MTPDAYGELVVALGPDLVSAVAAEYLLHWSPRGDARRDAPDSFADLGALVRTAGTAAEGVTVSLPGVPNRRLPTVGRTFVAAFGRELGQSPSQLAVYAAQAGEVLLDAIARSDGTRRSVVARLFETRVTNGLLGSFSIDPNGDTTTSSVAIYRIDHGTPRILRVITPPRSLTR